MHQRKRCSSFKERTSRHYQRRSRSPLHYLERKRTHYLDRNKSASRYSPDCLLDRSSTSDSKSLPHHFDRHWSSSHSPRRSGCKSPFNHSKIGDSSRDLRSRKSHSPPPKLNGEPSCYLDIDESSLRFYSDHLKPGGHKYHYSDVKEHNKYNECHYNRSPHTSPEHFPQTRPKESSTKLRRSYSPDQLSKSDYSFNGQIKSLEEADGMTDAEIYSLRISEASENKIKSFISDGISYIQAKRTIIKQDFIRNWNNKLKSKSVSTLHSHSITMSMSRDVETSNKQFANEKYNTDLRNSNRLNRTKYMRDTYLQSSHTHEEPAMTESLKFKNKNLSSAPSRAPTPGRYFDVLSNYQYPFQTVPGFEHPMLKRFAEDSQSSAPTFQCAEGIKNKQADDREMKPWLSGAGTRKHRRYLMQGMTKEKARDRAIIRPIAATASTCSDKESKPNQPMLRGFTKDWQPSTSRAVCPKDKQADHREKRIRLSGAGTRRYRRYLMQGMTKEEAREKALRPIAAKASTCSNKVPSKEKFQQGRLSAPPKPPNTSLDIGIIHASFPEKSLTNEQLDDIQESITDQIVALGLRRAELQPTFHSVRHRPGWLSLKCADKATADWLKRIATNLRPEKGVVVRVIEESKIPQKEILVVRLLRSQDYSSEKILALIGVQNDLDPSQWRVLERIQIGTVVEMTIEVDERSTAELKKREYKLSYKFGHVQLRAKKTN